MGMLAVAKRRQRTDIGFGRRLRAIREAAGLSQTELGERAGGMSLQQVAKYERSVSEPSWSVAVRLADALGVSLDALREASSLDASPSWAASPPASALPHRAMGKRK